MRISHRELEAALRNPGQWKRAQSEARSFGGLGYDDIVRLGILQYHKCNDADASILYVKRTLARHALRLKNSARINSVPESLASYITWAKRHHLDVVESWVNISFATHSGIEMRGRVTRVDLLEGGYRGVLLGTFSPTWDTELRFPLLQMALADHYSIPVEDTHVGVQLLDGTGLEQRQFDEGERAEALNRLGVLARELGLTE